MFEPKHTFESVSRKLVEGLAGGTLVLDVPWNDERISHIENTRTPPSRQWNSVLIVILVSCFVLLCVVSGAVAVLAQKNTNLQHEIARVSANLRDSSKRTAQLQENQTQIEEKLLLSQQAAEGYRQELAEARKMRLNSQVATYPNTGPSVETLMTLAMVHQESGDLARARSELLQALMIAQRAGNLRDEAATLERLGELYGREGDFAASEPSLQQAVAINQRLNDNQALARTLTALGTVVKRQGRADEARALYDRAAAILGDASAPGKGRLTIINDTGASMTVSWSGTNTGTQTFSGTVMLPLNKGEYTLNIKTQCGTRTESITIGDEGSKSITFSCRLIR